MIVPTFFFSPASRRLLGVAVIAAFLGAVWATFGGLPPRNYRLTPPEQNRVIAAASPLLDAIRAYKRDAGHPPTNLSALVPTYLSVLPAPPPELCSGRDFLYAVGGSDWRVAAPVRGTARAVLTFSSSGAYPHGKKGVPVERVGAWAYFHGDPY